MTERGYVEDLVDQEDDFDRWYVEVVQKAELADDAPVRGCKVIRPYGYGLWEQMVARLDARIKATGVENAYFPLFIPRSMLEREAEHIEGFRAGGGLGHPRRRPRAGGAVGGAADLRGDHLSELRAWVQSYRDLPILINQWGNVVRWEERPRAFLRTLEFLWQEGHTCHATRRGGGRARAADAGGLPRPSSKRTWRSRSCRGSRRESEKFAGALRTYTVEAMMGGKFWALQAGTSHDLGDHFGRVFDIRFLDRDGERKWAFNTSFGLSHRVVGATVMVHGDDAGLKLPPVVAPVQVIVVPIWRTDADLAAVDEAVERITERLAPVAGCGSIGATIARPGYKFNEWELKGVPLRLEVGPRDVAADQAIVVRRDTREKAARADELVGAGR